MARKTKLDFYFANHGSVALLTPLTRKAKYWLDEHVDDECQMHGNAIVIEPRYAGDILRGLQDDGLTVGV